MWTFSCPCLLHNQHPCSLLHVLLCFQSKCTLSLYHSIMIPFAPSQFFLLGLDMYLLTTPIAWAMSSRVLTMADMRLPIAHEYGTFAIFSFSTLDFRQSFLPSFKYTSIGVLNGFPLAYLNTKRPCECNLFKIWVFHIYDISYDAYQENDEHLPNSS